MKELVPPRRLAEERGTPDRLQEALTAARRGPDAASLERLSASLGVPAPLAPPAVPPVSGLAAGASGVSLGVAGLASVVVVGLGVGALALTGSLPGTPRVESAPSVVSATAAPRADSSPAASLNAPNTLNAPNAASTASPGGAAAPESGEGTEPKPSENTASTPAPVSPSAASRRHRAEPEASAPEPAPVTEPTLPPAAPADAASRLREEALLVRSAERLLGSDPSRALALTEERRRRFPGGALDQEAEVVAIDALLKLGRTDAAAARAKRFEASHPGSVHARRIHALLGQ